LAWPPETLLALTSFVKNYTTSAKLRGLCNFLGLPESPKRVWLGLAALDFLPTNRVLGVLA
jgi:hypothetical protein